MKLSKIDDSVISDHYHLTSDDLCYFGSNYKAGEGYGIGGTNQLIINFKMSVDVRGKKRYNYKIEAINKIAVALRGCINQNQLDKSVLVPIPPSKCKGDPLYDDRMSQVLRKAFPNNADVRELINSISSKAASHSTDDRPTIQELYNNLEIDNTLNQNVPEFIVLFDDVITTGAHFKACKQILLENFPNVKVVGVFVARREIDNDVLDFIDF